MTERRPLQYAVYKGVGGKFGAVQFNLQRPHFYKDKLKDFSGRLALNEEGRLQEGWRQREGAVFIEACSPSGNNEYNWEEKITFACSTVDMGKFVLALTNGQELKILHDPGAKTERAGMIQKNLRLFSKEGPLKGGAMMTLNEKSNDTVKEHKVPLSADECIVIRQLLLTAIPAALDW